AGGGPVAAGREEEALTTYIGAIGQRQPKAGGVSVATHFFSFPNTQARGESHAGGICRAQQAVDNRGGVVRDRKHPAVLLGLSLDAARREPLDRVARLPPMKRAEQLPPAPRIVRH